MHRLIIVLSVVFFPALAHAQTAEQKQATITFLQKLQQKDGGFLAAPASSAKAAKPGLRATSGAIRALKYFGGKPKDAKAAAGFVARCFDKASGGFADEPGGKPDVFTTAIGLMAVVELKLPAKNFAKPAVEFMSENARSFEDIRIAAAGLSYVDPRSPKTEAWLAEINKLRNPDGTYGKGAGIPRRTGSAVAAVLRLGGKVDQADGIIKALKAGQRDDGGYGTADAKGSDLGTSYRILRTFVMLKARPDVAKLRSFIGNCRNADGGYGVKPGQPSSVPATYFASIMLHWLDQK